MMQSFSSRGCSVNTPQLEGCMHSSTDTLDDREDGDEAGH